MRALFRLILLSLAALAPALAASGAPDGTTWPLEAPAVPFDDESALRPVEYVPLARAEKPWRLCVVYPHLKDAYWLSVNFGMVEEARRLGVGFVLYEAGGYPNVDRQIEQIETCAGSGADATVVGAVSYGELSEAIAHAAAKMPVVAAVNDIEDKGISAKASVPWRAMGYAAGRVIAERHPKGSAPVKLAWFPGPAGAGWVKFVSEGFRAAIAESSAVIVETRFGDTGREQQVLLVEEVLDARNDIDYLVGSGPMAEAAVSVLRGRGLSGRVQIVSTYMTHAVFRAIKRGKILAAPTDFPVWQGRLAIEQAVRAIEGRLTVAHAGPRIVTVSSQNIDAIGPEGSLAPASFAPVFEVAREAGGK